MMRTLSLIFTAILFLACTPASVPSGTSGASGFQGEPKYFGYYASQMDGIATTAEMDELKNYSNFVFIHSGEMAAKLQRCRELGMKAFVSFSWFTFDQNYRLYPDWQARVQEVFPVMDKYQDVIIAHYVLDEPYLNGSRNGVSVSEMYNALETVGQYFKARYPRMPLAVIFSAEEMNNGFKVMPSFDWFGMDCYGGFSKCGGSSIPGFYNVLRVEIEKLEKLDGRKRFFMAVPPSGFETKHPEDEQINLSQVPEYRNYLKNEPRFKVVIPFLWQSFGNGSDSWTGTKDSAKLKPAYQKFYQDFVANTL